MFLPLAGLLLLSSPVLDAAGQPGASFRLLRSFSGPSGRVAGDKFIFDEKRTRFVYPADKSFVVYFEWDAPPGTHVLTAIWKGSDGRPISISPDVKMETSARQLSAYWTYILNSAVPGGLWTVEIRIDGEPAGSHSLEVVIPVEEQPRPAVVQKRPPNLDELYRHKASLVWVHRLDEAGRRFDTGAGFVIGVNQVATAFQNVDACSRLEIEFEGGRKVVTDELWAWQRLQDWALIKVDTAGVPPLERGDPQGVPVGERPVVFNVESELARSIGGVDLVGRRNVPAFGDRIQYAPALPAEAMGGPLLNPSGQVIGVLGGNLTPGARVGRRQASLSPALWQRPLPFNAATPITLMPSTAPPAPSTLKSVLDRHDLTPEIKALSSLVFAGTTNAMPANLERGMPRDTSEFSRKDAGVFVHLSFQRRDRQQPGMLSGIVYDIRNRVRITIEPKKVRLSDEVFTRFAFRFPTANLEPGTYRVDALWDGAPVWRTFITITD